MTAPTTRETADHAELAAIISDDEIARVHDHANFGPSITPREVVNEGVLKYAVGYHSGHTQLCILMEHGLITKPRPGSYDANLTKKGKKYARVLYRSQSALLSEIAALRGEVQNGHEHLEFEVHRADQAERQRDEAVVLLREFHTRIMMERRCNSLGTNVAEPIMEKTRAFLATHGADQ